MDVAAVTRLARWAFAEPRVLLVAVPGAVETRLAVEAECRRRGWPVAASPAEADLLVTAGAPSPAMASAADRCWGGLPSPRARAHVDEPAGVGQVLDDAVGHLVAWPAQRVAARRRRPEGPPEDLGMADTAPDRDGLALDELGVTLGPILPAWPAGLVLHLRMQGDVIASCEAEDVGDHTGTGSFWDDPWLRSAAGDRVTRGQAARRRATGHLDSLHRLLNVAGWPAASARAAQARDALLAGGEPGRSLHRLLGRVESSRLLAAMCSGVGVLDAATCARLGVTGPAARAGHRGADVTARARQWCIEIREATRWFADPARLAQDDTDGPRGLIDDGSSSRALVDALPVAVTGLELAAARLTVASLDPDVGALAPVSQREGAGRG